MLDAFALPPVILNGLGLIISARYIYGSALFWLLWDDIVTFDDEVDLIWPQGITLSSVVFYVNRYGVAAMLTVLQYGSSGLSTGIHLADPNTSRNQKCQSIIAALLVGTTISSALVNAYMSYYYLLLWDRDRRAAITIWLLYFITYLPGGALAFKSVADYYKFVHYEPLVNGCYVTQQPVLMKGFWSFLVWFDSCAMLVVIVNALARPHRRVPDALKALVDDGVLWFAAMLVVRVGNLICVTRLDPEKAVLQLFHTWAFISILLSRFILRVERVRNPQRPMVYIWDKGLETFQMRNWSNPHVDVP